MVNKMNGKSLDITAQNIARLKELFPEILTDGEKIDFDMLKTVLGEVVETEQERYQFTWHGKKKMIAGAQKPSKGTLRPVQEKSKNFDSTENLYIEGDNLEALKLLQKSYNGKIKMIYIDPPYNTGKDFVYKDNFKDGVQNYLEQTGQVDAEGNFLSTNTESNGRFHTDWLNMIYARLKLAKNFLTDDGLIFISINDSEHKNLLKICDEIFGEQNFVSNLVWANKEGGGSSDSKLFRIKHEYIICYAKSIQSLEINGVAISNLERYTLYDEYLDRRGPYYLQKLGMGSIQYSTSLDYPIETPDGSFVKPADNNNGKKACWRWSEAKFQWGVKKGFIEMKKDSKGIWTVYSKQYLKVNNNDEQIVRTQRPLGIIDTFSSTQASKYLDNIGLGGAFDYSKPVDLIKYLIERISIKKNEIILDFFSGSATTAQAVMQLNAEDGGNRKYILVQLPERLDESSDAYKDGYQTICDIGEERIHRAGEKIKADLKEKQQKAGMLGEDAVDPDSLDIGFKVLKLDTSNIREWNVDFANLKDELDLYETPFIDDRSELDIVYEIMLKQGLELTYPIETFEVNGKKVYDIAFGSLFICLSKEITPEIAKAIIVRREEHGTETSSVIFSDAGFGDDSDKLNCIEILKDAGYPEDNLLTI
ncbi:site-specific DNA-methyltransferase [Bacillus altitudinis]|uniref:site-specific DNA-methyltransferase n=1 Tax=Bacillus altitudinis TaxID=293387 RepID=UPI0020204AC1|nr:site-specific DNA-methyltransferase [Bacillus altitudinis]MCL7872682.1 site-specific DNA-methyltransferase [Bacillus altitudinis]